MMTSAMMQGGYVEKARDEHALQPTEPKSRHRMSSLSNSYLVLYINVVVQVL
jgi:hypothetical protein